jgi:hypothetical protein
VGNLEVLSGVDRSPRERFRIVVRAGERASLDGATCQRSLCPDGTLFELVRLDHCLAGHDELTSAELDRFICEFSNRAIFMTVLARRIRRVEARFVPPEDPEGRRLVELLQARIRRWFEANGETYTPPSPEEFTGRSIVEILRERFNRPLSK